jgi:hypothetical protein
MGLAGAVSNAVVARAAAPPAPWTVVPSPNQTGTLSEISGISCTTASFCVAVGNYQPGFPRSQVLVEMWNGTSWSIDAAPNPSPTDDFLTGIACLTTTDCIAVGDTENEGWTGAFIESWNGSTWTVTAIQDPDIAAPYYLSSISCPALNFCAAAGSYANGTATLPMLQVWTAGVWGFEPAASGTTGQLESVACATTIACFAVGYSSALGTLQPIIESYNGVVWSAAPGDPSFTQGALFGVSCPLNASKDDPAACLAVGGSGSQGAAEAWNGVSWTLMPTPATENLTAVSCWTATLCVAVGLSSTGQESELRNGTGWTQTPMLQQSGGELVDAVSCTAGDFCLAGGYAADPTTGNDDVLAETWNGVTWSASPAVDFDFATNVLSSVSCVGATSCVGVGSYLSVNHPENPLWESGSGGTWSIMVSPLQSNADVSLSGVSCIAPNSCMAVGTYGDMPNQRPFSEQLSGSTWTTPVIAQQGLPDTANPLTSVSCTSATNCVAVGYDSGASGFMQTVVETWNGAAWSLVPSPDPSGGSVLAGVSCATAASCVAVGSTQNVSGGTATLIESLSGGTWSIVPSPNPTTGSNGTDELVSVDCTAATACTAVGSYVGASGNTQTLVETWNGVAWSVTPSPTEGGLSNTLSGVSCTSPSTCVAAGSWVNAFGAQQVLLEGWNGVAWSVMSSDSGTGGNALASVDCTTATACTAVGDAVNEGVDQTLVETGAGEPAVTTTATFDDSSAGVTYDTWSSVADATANGGTYVMSGTKTAKATYTFSGPQVTWVTRKGPNQGIAAVTVDGVKEAGVNLYSKTAQAFDQTYSGLAAGTHTLVVTVTGRRAVASSGTNVAVDAFTVGATTVQEYSSTISYDSWRDVALAAAFDGSCHVNQKGGASATFVFSGTSAQWITATGPSFGTAVVTIDGINEGTVDLYTAKTHRQVAETYGSLSAGTHTIVIAPTGSHNALSAGGSVVVDGFTVAS